MTKTVNIWFGLIIGLLGLRMMIQGGGTRERATERLRSSTALFAADSVQLLPPRSLGVTVPLARLNEMGSRDDVRPRFCRD